MKTDNKFLLIILALTIIVIISIISYAIKSYKEYVLSWQRVNNQQEEKKNSFNNALQNHTKLNLATYTAILDMFKCLNQYRASLKEIINLIENNAEVGYSVLLEKAKNEDYCSNAVLYFWLESYFSQYRLYLCYTSDIFYSFKNSIAYEVYIKLRNTLEEFTKYCEYVEHFINEENKKENDIENEI